jgi:hypothetical protein
MSATSPPLSTDESDRWVELIARHPDGLGLAALLRLLPDPPARRTLQRRLAELAAQGRLRTRGQARALRYLARSPIDYQTAPTPGLSALQSSVVREPDAKPGPARKAGLLEVVLSTEGREVRALVRRPLGMRTPVGYQLSFLERYHPNESAYLPPALRQQLHALGRSPADQAPAGTFARDILQRLLIDLSWASSHLEGNTYSQLDTERLIEQGQAADGKDAAETQMILNHKDAIEFLVRDPDQARLSPQTLIALHALLSDGLMPDPAACGRVRRCAVGIGGSVYLPLAVPQQLDELLGIVVSMADEIADPFEQAFFLMVHLPYLQPFEDVNKRVSRLAANIPFIRHNLCPLSFLDVEPALYVDAMLGVYELNRIELLRDLFVSAYARSCQQYVAVVRTLVPPDLFRLRHRQLLGQVVARLVRERQSPEPDTIRAALAKLAAPTLVPAEQTRFVDLVMQEFKSVHAGNAVRFGLRALEWEAWLSR